MSKGIIRLTVSNLLRLRAAEVTPDGALVVVGGRNSQGKSSLLNSIALALSGKDVPEEPIRRGASSGYVILELEDLIVTRKFSQSGGGSLEVRDKDGAKVTSPQAKLDALVSKITFDPFEFTRQEPKEQLRTIKSVAGLDFSEIDASYSKIYAERTDVNRSTKLQEGKLQGITRHSDAPVQPIVIADLMASLEAGQKANAENQDRRDALSEMNDDIDTHNERLATAERNLEAVRLQLTAAEQQVEHEKKCCAEIVEMRDRQKELVATLVDVDVSGFAGQIRDADAKNQKIRDNDRWKEEHKAFVALQQQSSALTASLEKLEKEKKDQLAAAKFPVEGLGFSENGVTMDGLPFEQAGTAAKIRVSVAIARSLNPKLPVMLVRDGSLLDEDSLRLLTQEAETHGCQIWMEVVGHRDDATVVIEDGEVIATPAATKKAKVQEVAA